jgi:sugar-specific transcriptional regulator TrmB
MDLKKLQENLMKFGFSKYETLVYTTLLMKGSSTASEIVEASGIPQPRLYDIVSSLERKGLIESHGGRPKKYWPLDPEEALPRFFSKFESAYKETLEVSEELYKKASTFTEKPSVWIVRGRGNVLSKMADMIKDSETELWAAIPDFLAERWGDVFVDKSSRGVSISLVVHPFVKKVENFKQMAERISIRMREIAGMSIIVADNRRCMVCPSRTLASEYPSELCYGIFMEENSELTQVINDFFFFTLWQPSQPANGVKVRKSASFVNVCTAVEYLEALRNQGKKASVSVAGKLLKTGEKVKISGRPETMVLERGGFRTMRLRTEDGKLVSIGSLGATLEDVEAEKITVTVL